MGVEIERKFLVIGETWRPRAAGTEIRQGYVCAGRERSVRVRIAGDKAFLTLKQARSGTCISRGEYEYAIPVDDAREMLADMCDGRRVEKVRYAVTVAGRDWVVDEFAGDNAGLVVAEIELDREDEAFTLPDWAGREVTTEPRYFNVSLIDRPFCRWTPAEKRGEAPAASGWP